MREDHSFGKAHRIVRQSDFARIKNKAKRSFSKNFILLELANDKEVQRLGLIVTKKVGKANIRNRWKRYVREFFRLNKKEFKTATDYVFIVKKGNEPPKEFNVICEEIKKLLKKRN